MIYLDTNATLWLAGAKEQLSEAALHSINTAESLTLSPMVVLEMEYLYEIGRIQQPAAVVLTHLRSALLVGICDRPFSAVVERAVTFKWTRDPFDRLITAQAALGENALLTRDKIIRANYAYAVW